MSSSTINGEQITTTNRHTRYTLGRDAAGILLAVGCSDRIFDRLLDRTLKPHYSVEKLSRRAGSRNDFLSNFGHPLRRLRHSLRCVLVKRVRPVPPDDLLTIEHRGGE